MDNGFQYGDIIFLALVAAFVALRLRSMLGRNMGGGSTDNVKPMASVLRVEDIVQRVEKTAKLNAPEEEALFAGIAGEDTKKAIADIQASDPEFSLKEFLAGARGAFEMVLSAFTRGDKDTLKMLLSASLYTTFSAEVDAQTVSEEKTQTTLIAIKSAEVIDARFKDKHSAALTVKFISEQVHVVRDKVGTVVAGDTSATVQVEDEWNLRARHTLAQPELDDYRHMKIDLSFPRKQESIAPHLRRNKLYRAHGALLDSRFRGNDNARAACVTIIFSIALLLLSACATPDKLTLSPTRYDAMMGWEEDSYHGALAAFIKSCEKILPKDDETTQGKGDLAAPARLWKPACTQAQDVATRNAAFHSRQFFEQSFSPFTAGNNGNPDGLFTGYYEPVINGSINRHGSYQTPIYRSPPERKDGEPFLTRAEIEAGGLAGRGLEIAWTDDKVKLFFLQIQGSGRIALDDGSEIKLGYGGGNGQPYVAIGKVMIDRGLLSKEEVTMISLRSWLREHPKQAQGIMNENPSYVFFRRYAGEGPIGAQKVALTPERSMAVDSRFIPMGTPLFMNTTMPYSAGGSDVPLRRLLVAQDTGGAIKGPVRGDVFFGFGAEAERLASGMKGRGGYTVLLPNEVAEYLGMSEKQPQPAPEIADAQEQAVEE